MSQVNELITNPPDPSTSASEGVGSSLQSLIGGQSLQSLLSGNHSNSQQLLEQLLSSGGIPPHSLPPNLFETIG